MFGFGKREVVGLEYRLQDAVTVCYAVATTGGSLPGLVPAIDKIFQDLLVLEIDAWEFFDDADAMVETARLACERGPEAVARRIGRSMRKELEPAHRPILLAACRSLAGEGRPNAPLAALVEALEPR